MGFNIKKMVESSSTNRHETLNNQLTVVSVTKTMDVYCKFILAHPFHSSKPVLTEEIPGSHTPPEASKFLRMKKFIDLIKLVCQMVQWQIFWFLVIFGLLYGGGFYFFNDKARVEFLVAVELGDDWKQLALFIGIYLSFALKKVSDVANVS